MVQAELNYEVNRHIQGIPKLEMTAVKELYGLQEHDQSQEAYLIKLYQTLQKTMDTNSNLFKHGAINVRIELPKVKNEYEIREGAEFAFTYGFTDLMVLLQKQQDKNFQEKIEMN